MRKSLWLLLLAAVVVSGCRAEANIHLTVDDAGAGSLVAEFGFDDEVLSFIEQAGGSPDDLFEVASDDEILEVRTDGDMTYYSATQPFTDIDELNDVVATLDAAEAEFSGFDLQLDGEGGASLDATLVAADTGDATGQFGGIDALGNVFSARFIADLPGRLDHSNADRVLPDGRLSWDIPIEGGRLDIEAVTVADTSSGFPIIGLIAAAAAIVLIVAGILWMRRRSKMATAAVTSREAPPAPSGWGDAE